MCSCTKDGCVHTRCDVVCPTLLTQLFLRLVAMLIALTAGAAPPHAPNNDHGWHWGVLDDWRGTGASGSHPAGAAAQPQASTQERVNETRWLRG